ncbi:hypothetical protein AB4233_10310 [Vibrio sp. 10N.286.45.F3]|uniref:hypothetical protein n=2 Tax=unclassified Vibrio TaxID=2614977 RepID=UPI00105663C3|nr:hypothetical protein [Vibrio sp. 10N.261.45.A1]
MMKKVILLSTLALTSTISLAEELSLQGYGNYQMSEFDTQMSAFAMAEKKALLDIAEQVQDKVMSVRSIDINGFYSRASWLVDLAVVEKTSLIKGIGLCPSSEGICTSVSLVANLDTTKSENQLRNIYADKKLLAKLEAVIESEKEYERQILSGYPVDVAVEKAKQSKRQEILEILTNRSFVITAGQVTPSVAALAGTMVHDSDIKQLASVSMHSTYLTMLNAIKSGLVVKIEGQKSIVHDDGTGGVRLKVKFKSDHLSKTASWVTEKLGLPNGSWEQYEDRRLNSYGDGWVHVLSRIGYDDLTDAVSVVKFDDSPIRPTKIAIQYGVDTHSKLLKGNGKPNFNLDHNKIDTVYDLGAHSVCVQFFLQPENVVERCVVGGEKYSKNRPLSSSWDADVPYLWYAENESTANVFIPLDKVTLRDQQAMRELKYQYKVIIKTNSNGA